MQKLSTYMAVALRRKLPQEVAERAKLHLVDTFAAIISGSRLLPGKRAIAYVKPFGGAVLGVGLAAEAKRNLRVYAELSAEANGVQRTYGIAAGLRYRW